MMSRNFTKREKILLLVLCILLLGILYYQLIYKTTAEALVKYDTGALEADLLIEQTKATNIIKMKAEMETNSNGDTGVVASYNNIKQEINALNDIFASATAYNFNFSQPLRDGDAVRRDINVAFTANSYAAVQKIIKELHNCKYRCLIKEISISSSDSGITSGVVSASLNLTFFETMYNATTTDGLQEATNDQQQKAQTE